MRIWWESLPDDSHRSTTNVPLIPPCGPGEGGVRGATGHQVLRDARFGDNVDTRPSDGSNPAYQPIDMTPEAADIRKPGR